MPVFDGASGLPLSVAAVEAALQHVVDSTPRTPPDAPPSLAVLTTAERDTWARAREELAAASPANRESLQRIDGALPH